MSIDARAAFDAGDDGFHEIQLNGKQLVFLGMATTLVSVVIFLCGVLVGRGVKPIDTVAQAAGPQVFDSPVAPAATALTAVPPGTIATPAPAPSPAPPAPLAGKGTAAAAAAAPVEDDTQPTPVGDDPDTAAPVAEHAAAAVAAATAAAKPSVESHAAAKPTPKPEAPKPAAKPAQATAVPPAVKPATPAPAPAAPAVTPKPAPAPALASTAPATSNGAIAVQVGAFNTRREADALAKRLSGKGYAVYVMNPTGDGKTVYRVRVGNYATADEAKNVSAKLSQQEKLKPWITR